MGLDLFSPNNSMMNYMRVASPNVMAMQNNAFNIFAPQIINNLTNNNNGSNSSDFGSSNNPFSGLLNPFGNGPQSNFINNFFNNFNTMGACRNGNGKWKNMTKDKLQNLLKKILTFAVVAMLFKKLFGNQQG